MIFDDAIEEVKAAETPPEIVVVLAKVTSTSNGKAMVQFYGESSPSTKEYPYIEGYKPAVNDVVCLLVQGNTFIILGKVSNENITTNYKPLASEVSGTYETQTHASNTYETQTHASNTYETSSHASSTYQKKTDAAGKFAYQNNSTFYLDWYDSVNIRPHSNKAIKLGSSNYQFREFYSEDIYLDGSPISSSDKRKKKSIKDLARKYKELLFRLCPVSYKYKDGTNGRTHTGFIAQEVEQAAADVGIELKDLAAVVIEKNGNYGIRYEEFIAILTAVVQDHERELRDLHDLVTDQQAKIDELGRELINIKKSMK